MTDIVIHDVESYVDLLNALALVQQVFTDPAAFQRDELEFSREEDESCPCEDCQPEAWPPVRKVNEPVEGPIPLVPCPDRGLHERLADCWLCWSDVHRGAATEADVLLGDWDLALRLLGGE